MGKADSLSRRPDLKKGIENDNKDVILLKPEVFIIRALQQGHVLINGKEEEILKRIKDAKEHNEAVVKAVEEMKKAKIKTLKEGEWQLEQDLVLYYGKVYVPNDSKLRIDIIAMHHDLPVSGHGGQWKTVELVTRNYWWPGITRDIKKYVLGCDKCQRNKNIPQQLAGKLMPNSIPDRPWQHISADFITKLPYSQGKDALLVVCDRFSKQVHLIPTTEETNAQGLAKLFQDHVWKLHGLPESIISDRGPHFAAQLTKELNEMLGIETKLSTAYHPQTDGQTERQNQSVETFLRIFTHYRQVDWPEWISIAEFAYNNSVHASTRTSPFYCNMGHHPRMGIEPRRVRVKQSSADFADNMLHIHEETKAAISNAQESMKRFAERNRSEAPEYKVGDKVWLETKNLRIKRPNKKLAEKRIGPFKITQIISANVVKLKLPNHFRIHPVFNVALIHPYRPPVEGQEMPKPEPVTFDDEEEYEVESILDSRLHRGELQYLVKWKNFTDDHNEWLDKISNTEHLKDLIQDFHVRFPDAVGKKLTIKIPARR